MRRPSDIFPSFVYLLIISFGCSHELVFIMFSFYRRFFRPLVIFVIRWFVRSFIHLFSVFFFSYLRSFPQITLYLMYLMVRLNKFNLDISHAPSLIFTSYVPPCDSLYLISRFWSFSSTVHIIRLGFITRSQATTSSCSPQLRRPQTASTCPQGRIHTCSLNLVGDYLNKKKLNKKKLKKKIEPET